MTDSHEGAPGTAGRASDPPAEVTRPSAPPDPLVGRTLNGRFRIARLLARGGMGKVYMAEQAPLGRVCALKVLNPSFEAEGQGDPEFHRRFFLEASTAAKLTHPNTVTIFDYGKAEGEDLYYIAMEYIDGKTLHRVLQEEGPLSESRATNIARQICRSLREAHRLGVVHRDLKPANVMISNQDDERDGVKVLDFGLVKDVSGTAEDLTQAGLFMGSPKYMSPEQITGGPVAAGTDVYSLGVLLFEMLTGKAPFDRGKSVMTLMAHVNDAVPRLADVRPEITVSEAVASIVYRCLEKDPSRRYQTMEQVLLALKRAGDGGPWESEGGEGQAGHLASSPSTSGRLPAVTPSVTPSASRTPPYSQIAAVQSVSFAEAAPIPPADTGVLERPPPRSSRLTIPFAIAIALAFALGTFIVLSSRRQASEQRGGASSAAPVIAAAVVPSAPAPPAAPPALSAPDPDAPSAPAQHAERVVLIDSDPSGATVSEGGIKICSPTPCNATFKGDLEHMLQLDKAGFKTANLTVAATDTKVRTLLEAVKATSAIVVPTPKIPSPQPPPPGTSGKIDSFKPSPY